MEEKVKSENNSKERKIIMSMRELDSFVPIPY